MFWRCDEEPTAAVIALPRRKFLVGAAALLAAPAIVRYESLMRVKPIVGLSHLEGEDVFVLSDFGVWTSDVRIARGIGQYDREFATSFWWSVDKRNWQYFSSHKSGE